MKRLVFALAVAGLFSGCAWHTQISKATISTRAFDFEKRYEIDRSRKIQGADRAHSLWLLPLGSPDATDAIKTTINEENKKRLNRKIVGLAEADVKFRFLWLYLYSQRWYTVEGYPIYEKK